MTTPPDPGRREAPPAARSSVYEGDPSDHSDEVSLRDLYLVLLRGLPLILIFTLVAGAVAYWLNAQREPVYVAESTVLVTPPPIRIEGDETLAFSPINEVSFQTYETLARSQLVLQDAVSRLPDARIGPNQLSGLGTLRQLIGPQRADQVAPLSVIHRVRNSDPELAAELADVWAQSSLQAVRDSLFASLSPVDETTAREVARLQRNVEEVEDRVQTFAAQDNGRLLEAELDGLTRQLTGGRERQGLLEREIAAAEARLRALQEQLGGEPTGAANTGALTPATVELLSAQAELRAAERAPPTPNLAAGTALRRTAETALAESTLLSQLFLGNEAAFSELAGALYGSVSRTLEETLAAGGAEAQRAARAQAQTGLELALLGFAVQAPETESPGTPTSDTLSLLTAAEARRERVALAGLRAEQEVLTRELTGYTEEAAAIQQQLAVLEQRRSRLERELENALASYTTVAGLQSSVSYLTELAPTNARILSEASVPTAPSGPRRAFNTGLAAVLGSLAGLVLVFLRAAVRPPTPSRKVTS